MPEATDRYPCRTARPPEAHAPSTRVAGTCSSENPDASATSAPTCS